MPHVIPGYGVPKNNRPQWYVGYTTFQNGVRHMALASQTGGGFAYKKSVNGNFRPVFIAHTGPTTSLTGGGLVPPNMPWLTQLFGNPNGGNIGS